MKHNRICRCRWQQRANEYSEKHNGLLLLQSESMNTEAESSRGILKPGILKRRFSDMLHVLKRRSSSQLDKTDLGSQCFEGTMKHDLSDAEKSEQKVKEMHVDDLCLTYCGIGQDSSSKLTGPTWHQHHLQCCLQRNYHNRPNRHHRSLFFLHYD